jgi:glutaminyl-peptide cyclotransferase
VIRTYLLRLAAYPLCLLAVIVGVSACSHGSNQPASNNVSAAPATSSSPAQLGPADAAPPPSQTGGFDGAAAYDYTQKLVSFGPRPPASDAIRQTQDYILSSLKSFGCPVDVDDFHASTPIGDLAMKNIVVKIPGEGPGIILLLTHYDTVRIPGFVGADDAGSSSGLMLEMARVLCAGKEREPNAVWIAFLDGEEAQLVQDGVAQWTADDSVFGSRELAARMDLSGDLKRVRAVLLADMVGAKGISIRQDPGSTAWLNSLVWKVADRLGYRNVFIVASNGGVEDDHTPFLSHHVPAADITEFPNYPYWHTTQDTMDKLSPRSLAIVGHVFLESVHELQQRNR